MDTIERLQAQGYTAEEAQLVAQVTATAAADRDIVQRTGRCGCGGRMRRYAGGLGCRRCRAVVAA